MPAGKGHNSGDTILDMNAQDALKSIVSRLENLDDQKDAISLDIKSVLAEANSAGFHAPTLRKIVARRKQDQAKLAEAEAIFDLYFHAVFG